MRDRRARISDWLKRASAVGLAVAVAAAAGIVWSGSGHAATPLLPDMRALPARDLRIDTGSDGHTYLRLSATTWNAGDGPLELLGGEIDSASGKQQVHQRVYNSDGSSTLYLAGTFEWHPEHNHVHFNDYALYTLQPVDAPGASSRTASKTTFCIIDTTRVKRLPGAPKRPVYTSCGGAVQGMSRGWGDKYPYYLAGQAIDVTGLPDGDYELTIEVDYKNRIVEMDDTNNTSSVLIQLAGGTVKVLSGHGNAP